MQAGRGRFRARTQVVAGLIFDDDSDTKESTVHTRIVERARVLDLKEVKVGHETPIELIGRSAVGDGVSFEHALLEVFGMEEAALVVVDVQFFLVDRFADRRANVEDVVEGVWRVRMSFGLDHVDVRVLARVLEEAFDGEESSVAVRTCQLENQALVLMS